MSAAFVGCETVLRAVELPARVALGEFRMKEATTEISGVTVVGRRPFVEQRADRYVVNVSNHIVTAGRNAMDVLANTPGVPVRDGRCR